MARMGYEQAAVEIQDKFLAKDYAGAAGSVPLDFLDRTSLLGPPERVQDRLAAYAEAGVTTLTVSSVAGSLEERVQTLRLMAEALDRSGLGG